MVMETDEWSGPLLLLTNSDLCEICGKPHELEKCSLINTSLEHIKDKSTLSYAHLTLPEGLEVKQLVEGRKTVIASKPFSKGVQFGPFIAKTSVLMDIRIDFPIKVFFSDEESVYLESYEELFCNWMCFVSPASNQQEQNLFCYQVKTSIYFCTMRDIEKGQELRVWYAPYYAEKMGVQCFAKPAEQIHSSDEEFQEIVASLQSGVEIQDHLYMPKLKKRRKLPRKPILGENYYREIPPSDLLPGELLGARERRQEWQCTECGQLETNVAAYARHLMEHYRLPPQKTFFCPYCPRWFRKDGFNRFTHIQHCKQQHDEKEAEKKQGSPNQLNSLSEKPLNAESTLSKQAKTKEGDLNPINDSNLENYLPFITISTVNVEGDNDQNGASSNVPPSDEICASENNLMDQSLNSRPTDETESSSKLWDEQFQSVTNSVKETQESPSRNISEKFVWSTSTSLDKTNKVESAKSCSNVEEKNNWNKDSKLFEPEKNMGLESLTENLLSKTHLNPPILDLSDDIEFHLTKSFAEMISDDCNLEKSLSFSKNNRSLDLFDSVPGPSLLSSEISVPQTPLEPSFYSLGKNNFLQSSFTSCDDVTDEERNRIVENLLSETDDKFHVSDYEITDACVSENPDSECNNENSKENEKNSSTKKGARNHGDFKCDICGKCFGKQLYLFRHLRKHTGEFRCNICFMVFARKENLQTHRLMCPQEAATQQTVTRMRVHCSFCKLQFHSLVSLKAHMELHFCKGDTWKCNCEKTSNDPTLIENHDCPMGKVSISCVSCLKVFASAEEFTNHKNQVAHKLKRKNQDFSTVCEFCGLTFKSATGTRLHRLAHGERKFECSVCGKKFIRNDIMNEHRKLHEQPLWACPVCGKKYPSQKLFKSHYRTMHSPVSHICQYCDKVFRQKGNLQKHLKTHKQTHRIPCNACDRQFSNKSDLENHLKTHKAGQLFQCSLCDRVYHVEHQLKTHIRRAHHEMYRCAYCEMDIRYRHTLKKHLASKHSDKIDEWDNTDAIKAMFRSQSDDQELVSEVPKEVLTLPLTVISDFQLAPPVEADKSPSPHELPISLNIEPDQADPGLVTTLENAIVNFPLTLPEGYQLALNDDSAIKQGGYEHEGALINIGDVQSIDGTSAYVLSDGSVIQPDLPPENVLFYIIDTSPSKMLS